MSDYQVPINFSYFSYRDIFLILFLIFFLNLFTYSKIKTLSLFLIAVIASIAFIFHFDTGVFLNVTLFLYALYLLITKRNFEFLIIFTSIIIIWSLIILILGLAELDPAGDLNSDGLVNVLDVVILVNMILGE